MGNSHRGGAGRPCGRREKTGAATSPPRGRRREAPMASPRGPPRHREASTATTPMTQSRRSKRVPSLSFVAEWDNQTSPGLPRQRVHNKLPTYFRYRTHRPAARRHLRPGRQRNTFRHRRRGRPKRSQRAMATPPHGPPLFVALHLRPHLGPHRRQRTSNTRHTFVVPRDVLQYVRRVQNMFRNDPSRSFFVNQGNDLDLAPPDHGIINDLFSWERRAPLFVEHHPP